MRRPIAVLLVATVVLAGCGDDDDDDATTTSTTTSSSTTSTTEATTTTVPFDGSTDPTSAPSTASGVALLTDVTVTSEGPIERVTFTFRDELPGYDVAYVEPPITEDASGEEVDVDGDAFVHVRMEPASGVDLSGEEFEETYTGPGRIEAGLTCVVEVVRTGDFEAVLSWVIGIRGEPRPFKVVAESSTLTIEVLSD
jgi:hypothetical protein